MSSALREIIVDKQENKNFIIALSYMLVFKSWTQYILSQMDAISLTLSLL